MDADTARLTPSFLPPTVILELTYRCNHQCLFCSNPWYRDSSNYPVLPELDSADWRGLIHKLCTLGVTSIAFSGGEPLLKEGIYQIIEYAASCQSKHLELREGILMTGYAPPGLSILTNGRILDRAMLEFCRHHGIHLGISLPGIDSYSTLTGGGSMEKVLTSLSEAAARGITTNIGVTVTKKNFHELYETLSRGLIAGAGSVLLNRFLPGGRGSRYSRELLLTKQETREMLDCAEEVLHTANRKGIVGTAIPECIARGITYRSLTVGSRCSAAVDFFVIDPSGYVRVCNHSETRLTHWTELESLRIHPYWQQFTARDYLPGTCERCENSLSCDGGCREAAYIEGGHLRAMDPCLDM